MKTSLKVLSFLLAVGVPSALFAQFAGASVPDALDALDGSHLFVAFVFTLMLLTVVSDYSREDRVLAHGNLARRHTANSALGRTEVHRLAA